MGEVAAAGGKNGTLVDTGTAIPSALCRILTPLIGIGMMSPLSDMVLTLWLKRNRVLLCLEKLGLMLVSDDWMMDRADRMGESLQVLAG